MKASAVLFFLDDVTADYRVNHSGLANVIGICSKDILGQHDQISQLANFKRAFVLLGKLGVSSRRGVSSDSFFDCDLLFGHPTARVLTVECLARDCSVDS